MGITYCGILQRRAPQEKYFDKAFQIHVLRIFHLNKSFREDILIRQEQELFIELSLHELLSEYSWLFSTLKRSDQSAVLTATHQSFLFLVFFLYPEVEFNSLEIAVIKSWNG